MGYQSKIINTYSVQKLYNARLMPSPTLQSWLRSSSSCYHLLMHVISLLGFWLLFRAVHQRFHVSCLQQVKHTKELLEKIIGTNVCIAGYLMLLASPVTDKIPEFTKAPLISLVGQCSLGKTATNPLLLNHFSDKVVIFS